MHFSTGPWRLIPHPKAMALEGQMLMGNKGSVTGEGASLIPFIIGANASLKSSNPLYGHLSFYWGRERGQEDKERRRAE